MNRKRLDRLAKGAFVKVRSMAWDVWIHDCSHGLLDGGYGYEGFHGCIAMVFLLNNTWVMDVFGGWVFPSMRVSPGYILYHKFFWYVVYSLACGF